MSEPRGACPALSDSLAHATQHSPARAAPCPQPRSTPASWAVPTCEGAQGHEQSHAAHGGSSLCPGTVAGVCKGGLFQAGVGGLCPASPAQCPAVQPRHCQLFSSRGLKLLSNDSGEWGHGPGPGTGPGPAGAGKMSLPDMSCHSTRERLAKCPQQGQETGCPCLSLLRPHHPSILGTAMPALPLDVGSCARAFPPCAVPGGLPGPWVLAVMPRVTGQQRLAEPRGWQGCWESPEDASRALGCSWGAAASWAWLLEGHF